MKIITNTTLMIIVSLGLLSCSDPSYVQKEDLIADIPLIDKVVFSVDPNFDPEEIKCVAVLPFVAPIKTTDVFAEVSEDPSLVIRRSFFAHLAPYAYNDIEIERIDFIIKKEQYDNPGIRTHLSQHNNCNTVIEGKIIEFQKKNYILYSHIKVGLEVTMINSRTEEVLWEAKKISQSRGGDIPLSPLSLLTSVYRSHKNTQDEQLFRLIDEMNRHLINTLPKPTYTSFDEMDEKSIKNKYTLLTQLEMTNNSAEKENILKQLYINYPENIDYAKRLSDFYMGEARYEESFVISQTAINAFPNEDSLHFLNGRAAIKLLNYNEAEKQFIKAVSLNRANVNYYNALGYAYSMQGKSNKAFAAYQMALDRNPDNSFAHYNMAIEFLNQGKTSKAVTKLYDSGNSYMKESRYDKAIMVINTLESLQTNNYDVGNRLELLEVSLSESLDTWN